MIAIELTALRSCVIAARSTIDSAMNLRWLILTAWFRQVFGCSRTRLALIDSGDYRRRRVPLHCFSWEPLRLRDSWSLLGRERSNLNRPLAPVAWWLGPLPGKDFAVANQPFIRV